MNSIIKHENKLTHAMAHHEHQLSSFMLNIDKRFENLMLAVNNTAILLNNTSEAYEAELKHVKDLNLHISQLIVKQINSSTVVNTQLENLKMAIHELVQGRISPYLIAPDIISKTIRQIQSILNKQFKGFKILKSGPYFFLFIFTICLCS